MFKYINHSQPVIENDDIESVVNTLKSGIVAKSNLNKEFEDQFNNYLSSIRTSLVNSGRSALFLALKMLNVEKNDEIIIPTYVCSSVLKTIKLFGATPVLADIDDNYCLNQDIIDKYTTNRTKAIIYVHTFGIIFNIESIANTLRNKKIYLIEDCAHSIGGVYNDKKLGTFGDLSFFSFQATKMLTSGEGGAVVLNNSDLENNFKNTIEEYGKLFCLSDINASLLLSQLSKIDIFIEQRRELAQVYIDNFKNISQIELPITDLKQSIFFRFLIHVNCIDFEGLKEYMHAHHVSIRKGVDSMLHTVDDEKYKNANNLFNKTISLPIYPSLTIKDINNIARIVIKGVS